MSTRFDAVGPLVHLRTLPPFRTLSPTQIGLLISEASEVGLTAGGWLVPAGEAPPGIFMLLDGYVHVRDPSGDRVLEPWSLAGYPDVLVPERVSTGIRAETDIVALRLETDDLRNLCERHFAILAALMTNMAGDVLAHPTARAKALVSGKDWGPLPFGGVLDRVGRMMALQRSPVLPRESMDALAELADRVHRLDLEPGDALWSKHQVAETFHIVAVGSLAIGAGTDSASTLGVGSAPGFLEMMAGKSYSEAPVATVPTSVLSIGIDSFMDVAEDHFELGYAVLGRMARWLLSSS